MLELKNVKKAYHSTPVVQVDSFTLEKGVYHLIGANGTGKTTLLKMIAGLLPFAGDIIFKGISQRKNPIHYRRHVSWAEAEPLYPSFVTGRDLLALYRHIRNVDQGESDSVMQSFNMTSYIDDAAGTYSAGMTKKLALLLAFTGLPPICLLDEPFITLDDGSAEFISNRIMEKHEQAGTTFIISSHQETDLPVFNRCKKLFIINQHVSFESH